MHYAERLRYLQEYRIKFCPFFQNRHCLELYLWRGILEKQKARVRNDILA